MKIMTTYSVKIKKPNKVFKDTMAVFRNAVDWLIDVCMQEWEDISAAGSPTAQFNHVEKLVHKTKNNPEPKYAFDDAFYKFPNYLRRAAIKQAIGKVSSYKSNLANWEEADPRTRGRAPGEPRAGFSYPVLYRGGDTFVYDKENDRYKASIKVYIRNTWDWITVSLRKSDVDYITRRCKNRHECAPTLRKRGKQWYLDFPFEEKATLNDTEVFDRTIVAVDLGLNNACTCSVMRSDGTILGRHFYKLSKEYDSLQHALGRIKKAQRSGARKMPRLWSTAKGINDGISVLTAQFIMDIATLYNADVIVFEHLNVRGKKRGSKKQRLHHWRADYVQAMVTDKAHRAGMRISRICAWGTSKFAYDGSGVVQRGKKAELDSYSVCRFKTGKIYNCDLNAAYNIGARYFIREILKTVPETAWQDIEAKAPRCLKRSTCTWIDLINLNAALAS